jgi:hypothetical protein
MASYYRTHPAPAEWQPPFDLAQATVDRESGMLATESCPGEHVATEWFLPGTQPTAYCTLHPEPGVGGWFRRRMRDLGEIFGGRPDTTTRP